MKKLASEEHMMEKLRKQLASITISKKEATKSMAKVFKADKKKEAKILKLDGDNSKHLKVHRVIHRRRKAHKTSGNTGRKR
jgi:exopolysaccharide biosynthesis protein